MARLTRVNRGNSHSYRLDGRTVPGVTSIIGQLDKPALVNWAAKEVADFAVRDWARLSEIDAPARYEALKSAHRSKNRKAQIRGTRIHALGERLARGETVEAAAELRPQVEGYARLLDMWEVETVATECPVASTAYRYGGTFDALFQVPKLGRVLADIKTGKAVYDTTALQLAAYRHADLVLTPEVGPPGPRGGRPKTTWVEEPMPDVDMCAVVHIRDDGIVELVPIEADLEVHRAFLYLVGLWNVWHERVDWSARDRETFAPVVGEPLHLEAS